MASDDGLLGPAEIRALADRLGVRPTKTLGQNFLHDPNTIRRIVRVAGVGPEDVVLEVGPGLGSLTLGLLGAAAAVVAVEIDPVLAAALPETVFDRLPDRADRLSVLTADALTLSYAVPGTAVAQPDTAGPGAVLGSTAGLAFPGSAAGPLAPAQGSTALDQGSTEPGRGAGAGLSGSSAGPAGPRQGPAVLGKGPTALVANLPYNVAVPVVLHLLETVPTLRTGLVMVQSEVADRLAAPPGSRTYGVPSAKAAWYCSVTKAGAVPRAVFWPVPNVDSGLVRLVRRSPPPGDRRATFAVIDAAFAQRRKTLRAALTGWAGSAAQAEEALRAAGVDPSARGETLGVATFARVAAARTEAAPSRPSVEVPRPSQ